MQENILKTPVKKIFIGRRIQIRLTAAFPLGNKMQKKDIVEQHSNY